MGRMTKAAPETLGEPSYVWRAGQERRLAMIARWAPLKDARVLVVGCGLGLYAIEIRKRHTPHVHALDVEYTRVQEAHKRIPHAIVAEAEALPYPADAFDVVLSNEVLEHVRDDRASMAEMARVARPGGRIVIFCPNRWYPFETHGFYWRGVYHFGNIPAINYLPNRLRDRLAPHVRAYTYRGLMKLIDGLPVRVLHHRRIFGGYDNLAARLGPIGRLMRRILYTLEGSPLDWWGLSHLLILEKNTSSMDS